MISDEEATSSSMLKPTDERIFSSISEWIEGTHLMFKWLETATHHLQLRTENHIARQNIMGLSSKKNIIFKRYWYIKTIFMAKNKDIFVYKDWKEKETYEVSKRKICLNWTYMAMYMVWQHVKWKDISIDVQVYANICLE